MCDVCVCVWLSFYFIRKSNLILFKPSKRDFYDDKEFNVAKTTIYLDDWSFYINIEIRPETIKGQFIKQSTLKNKH